MPAVAVAVSAAESQCSVPSYLPYRRPAWHVAFAADHLEEEFATRSKGRTAIRRSGSPLSLF